MIRKDHISSATISPPDPLECPEECPHASDDLYPPNCPLDHCIYEPTPWDWD